jgi:uncharacterized surface protein with fasciclin (FAS1) repeats
MKLSPKTLALGLGLATTVAAANPLMALANGKSEAAKDARPSGETIVQIVLRDDGEFDLLQAAVIKAGLVDALNGNTQYTVFAPTDAAFVAALSPLSEGVVVDEASAKSFIENADANTTALLTNVLLYHVTEGRRISTSVLAAPQYQMLGGTLTRDQLAAAGIEATDISASNGVIHVINSVLLPN